MSFGDWKACCRGEEWGPCILGSFISLDMKKENMSSAFVGKVEVGMGKEQQEEQEQ